MSIPAVDGEVGVGQGATKPVKSVAIAVLSGFKPDRKTISFVIENPNLKMYRISM